MTPAAKQILTQWAVGAPVAFLCFELFARIDDYVVWGAPMTSAYNDKNLIASEPHGGRCRPNGQFEKWKLNSHGFRNAEHTIAKPPTTKRIVVVGASESLGLYESAGMEFPAQLQSMLDRHSEEKFEVLNASCGGIQLPTIMAFLNAHVAKFDPDIILIYPTPHFYLQSAPKSASPPRLNLDQEFELRLTRKVWSLARRLTPVTVQVWAREYLIGRSVSAHPPDWVWQEAPQDRLLLFEQDLGALVTGASTIADRVLLATHGNRFGTQSFDVDPANAIAWRRYYPRASLETLIAMDRAANASIRQLAASRNVGLVDVAALVEASPENYADFSHFTDHGAEAVARAVLEAVFNDP